MKTKTKIVVEGINVVNGGEEGLKIVNEVLNLFGSIGTITFVLTPGLRGTGFYGIEKIPGRRMTFHIPELPSYRLYESGTPNSSDFLNRMACYLIGVKLSRMNKIGYPLSGRDEDFPEFLTWAFENYAEALEEGKTQEEAEEALWDTDYAGCFLEIFGRVLE